MKSTRYLVIGGGLAGKQAVKQLRKEDADAAITLVGSEPHQPYDRPPLSKEFLQGEKERPELFFEAETYYQDNGIETILGAAVTALDPGAKSAALETGESIDFEKAMMATGGTPIRLPVPGGDLAGIHYLRTLDDAEAIAAAARAAESAVVIGAGFIGMETAASLTKLGLKVSVIEAAPYIWSRFIDAQLADYFQEYCGAKGISFHCGETVTEFRGDERVTAVVTASAKHVPCDFVCVGIGIHPNTEIGRNAGLAEDNGIVVDDRLQTSHPDIYAAGDIINYPDSQSGRRRRVEHWSHANYCGLLAAQNMAGGDRPYNFQSFVWSDIFDLALKFAGDETGHDRILVRGTLETNSFSVIYLSGAAMTGCLAVNPDMREFGAMRSIMQKKIDVTGRDDELQDTGFDLKSV